ncbi:TPA: hypothetical protein N0F65_011675 [Lagenidium giganteum]|uniref:Bifunctional lysine-specific demethylase and histidyl-hydroxylase n=1 Tax=Lagenidium giganteum TaxID=4803 RepID=A0AAV2ZAJ1_9STRA|nr:TPA: hypothetical protein N0F65_011675 [Lagenidium giganteum]
MAKQATKGSGDSGAPSGKRRKTNSKEDEVPLLVTKEINEDDVIDSHELASNIELHSAMKGKLLFEWLIYPVTLEDFYANYWEKRPLAIKRKLPKYYDGWFSKDEINRILEDHTLEYGADLDLTKYVDETRHTLNAPGAATSKQVWKHFDDGCSVRLLCPQKFSDPLWRLLSILEHEWGCMAGANTYLTPKNTQGFAPHYDDIEAFLLQVEGTKHWKIYAPLDEARTLPRYSSGNFAQNEVGTPILEVDLEEGDLLYFPRGFVHQAKSSKEHHSLHVTLSTGQQNTIGNFLELLLPEAVAAAINNNVELRRSLPRDYLEYMGVMHSDKDDDPRRTEFSERMKKTLRVVMAEAMSMLDAGSDQMAKHFLADRLPPALEEEEENCTVESSPLLKVTVNTQMRLLRHDLARLVIEDGKAVVYHCKENGRLHHEVPVEALEYELDDAESIEFIFKSYPEYFRVGDLPHEDSDDQIGLVKSLYDAGLLMFLKDE